MITAAVSAVILAVIDQISKIAALKYLKPVQSISLINGIMNLTFVENRGAAFGMLSGARWFFVIITIIVTAAILIYIKKYMPKTMNTDLLRLLLHSYLREHGAT